MPKRILKGIIVSDKPDKTVIVKVTSTVTHPKYKKIIKRTKKYAAHDEENAYKAGDIVNIVESVPISKTKKWQVVEKVK